MSHSMDRNKQLARPHRQPALSPEEKYESVKQFIRGMAGMELSGSKYPAVIEDCRKICDVMGWPV